MADKTIKTLPTKDTTLIELLRMGAKITFGSGRSMQGSPSDGYIQVANEFGSLGLWDMDLEKGVAEAVHDLERDAAESQMTLHGESIPDSAEVDTGFGAAEDEGPDGGAED